MNPVLIGARPEDGQLLSEYEYSAATAAIRFVRSEDREALAIVRALSACGDEENKSKVSTLTQFFSMLVLELGEHVEQIQGILVEPDERPLLLLQEHDGADRVKCLKALDDILRRDGWLASWLEVSILCWAQHRAHTPLHVMWSLSEQAANFESDIDDANRLIQSWPQFFAKSAKPARPAPSQKPDEGEEDNE